MPLPGFIFGEAALPLAKNKKHRGGKKGKKYQKKSLSYPQDIHTRIFLQKIFRNDKFFTPQAGMSVAGEEAFMLDKAWRFFLC